MDTLPKFELYSKVRMRGEHCSFFVTARYYEYDLKQWQYFLRDPHGPCGGLVQEVLLEAVVEKEPG